MLRVLLALWLVGSGWAAGDFSFDTTSGTEDGVTIANLSPFNSGSAHSFVAWYHHPAAASIKYLVARFNTGNRFHHRCAITASNDLYVDGYDNAAGGAGSAYLLSSTADAGVDAWVCTATAFSVASSNATLYNAGVSVLTDDSVSSGDATSPVAFRIGYRTSAGFDDFTGLIDSPRYYSRKLDPTEVVALSQANYRSSHVSWSGLEGYWPMKGVAGTDMGTVVDYSNGNRSPGTAGGTTLPTYTGSILRGVH